jgi:hypothetical protein
VPATVRIVDLARRAGGAAPPRWTAEQRQQRRDLPTIPQLSQRVHDIGLHHLIRIFQDRNDVLHRGAGAEVVFAREAVYVAGDYYTMDRT